MEIFLIRHTLTVASKGLCYGQTDLDLQVPYLNQFCKINEYLQPNNAIVYSSPLLRCTKMAKYLTPNVLIDDRLKELNFGNWENTNWRDIDLASSEKWMNDFVNEAPPNGESFVELTSRVKSFIGELTKNKALLDHKIIIVSHAGVIRGILCSLLEIPLKNAFSLAVDFGSISKINIVDGHVLLKYLNKIL